MRVRKIWFRLVLARHGLSELNKARHEAARTGNLRALRNTVDKWPNDSVPLAREAEPQIMALRATLDRTYAIKEIGRNFDAYVTSKMRRAIQTGKSVYKDAPWTQDQRLNEQKMDELMLLKPNDPCVIKWLAQKQVNRLTAVPPGGESFLDVFVRIAPLVEEWLSAANHGTRKLAIGHGGMNVALLASLAGMSPDQVQHAMATRSEWIRIGNCDCIEFLVFTTGEGMYRILRPTLSGRPIEIVPWTEVRRVGLHPGFVQLIARK